MERAVPIDSFIVRKFEATELRLGPPVPDDVRNKKRTLIDLNHGPLNDSSDDECRRSDSAHAPFVPASPVLASNCRRYDYAHDPPVVASKSKKGRASIEELSPMESYRKDSSEAEGGGSGKYVKVSKDGEPYHRKTNLMAYKGYPDLFEALGNMFKFTIGEYSEREEDYEGSGFAPAYEDKDGDWILVGDVPWEMFKRSCKRLRIMKGHFS